jgi:hypothetical protein
MNDDYTRANVPVVMPSGMELFRAPYPYLPNKHVRVGDVEVCFVKQVSRWETPRDLTPQERTDFLAAVAERNRVSAEIAAKIKPSPLR